MLYQPLYSVQAAQPQPDLHSSRCVRCMLADALVPTPPPLLLLLQASQAYSTGWRLVSYSLRWVLSAPLWLALWGFATAVCILTLVLVGALLHRQLVLLVRGQSYLDTLQHTRQYQQQYQQLCPAGAAASMAPAGASGALGQSVRPVSIGTVPPGAAGAGLRPPRGISRAVWESARMRSMRRVFGDGHPLLWLLPWGERFQLTSGGPKKQS